jgi:hypothetical protein
MKRTSFIFCLLTKTLLIRLLNFCTRTSIKIFFMLYLFVYERFCVNTTIFYTDSMYNVLMEHSGIGKVIRYIL